MENDEENKKNLNELTEDEKIERDLKNLKEAMEAIDKMTTLDKYRWLLASYADNRAYRKEMKKKKKNEMKKEKSDSLIRRIMNKFNTSKDDEDTIIEEKESEK